MKNMISKSMLLLPDSRTDVAAAKRFVAEHGEDLRYVSTWGKWIHWDGSRWQLDETLEVERRAKITAKGIWTDVSALIHDRAIGSRDFIAFGKAMSSARGLSSMIDLAKSDLVVTHSELDQDPMLFVVRNGTIDLRTGLLRQSERSDLLTKSSGIIFDDFAKCHEWYRFLISTFDDAEIIGYIRRLIGYCLTGQTNHAILTILNGNGANGKSVFVETLQCLLGEYATICDPHMLLSKHGDNHPTEVASLYGMRLVTCSETDEGRRLDEAKIKMLTGADSLQARRMREDFWTFKPTHKMMLATNHKPQVRGTDTGIWRRLKLIPFSKTFIGPNCDPNLLVKLKLELPGILKWAMQGCIDYRLDGLQEPKVVSDATAEYRSSEDVIGAWLQEHCDINPGFQSKASDLYASYGRWCDESGEFAINQRRFGQQMTERGFKKFKSGNYFYQGLSLRVEST